MEISNYKEFNRHLLEALNRHRLSSSPNFTRALKGMTILDDISNEMASTNNMNFQIDKSPYFPLKQQALEALFPTKSLNFNLMYNDKSPFNSNFESAKYIFQAQYRLELLVGGVVDHLKKGEFEQCLAFIVKYVSFTSLANVNNLDSTLINNERASLPDFIKFIFDIFLAIIRFILCLTKKQDPLDYQQAPSQGISTFDDIGKLICVCIFESFFSEFIEFDRSFFFVNYYDIAAKEGDDLYPTGVQINSAMIKKIFHKSGIPLTKNVEQLQLVGAPSVEEYSNNTSILLQSITTAKNWDSNSLNFKLGTILADSTDLWLDIVDKMDLSNMSRSEQVNHLFKSKIAVAKKCVQNMMVDTDQGDIDNVAKDSIESELFKIMEMLEIALKEHDDLYQIYKSQYLKANNTKQTIYDFMRKNGATEVQTLNQIFSILDNKIDAEINLDIGSELGKILIEYLNKYRDMKHRSIITKGRCDEIYSNIKNLEKRLSLISNDFVLTSSRMATINTLELAKYLKSYTVFAFIVFNDNLFPHANPEKLLSYKKGANKLANILQRRKRAAFQKILDQDNSSYMQSIIFDQFAYVLNSYTDKDRKSVVNIDYKLLSYDKLQKIEEVLTKMEDPNEKPTLERFNQFNAILRNFIINQGALYGAINTKTRGHSFSKLSQWVALYQTALIYVDQPSLAFLNGTSNASIFSIIKRKLLDSISNEGFIERRLEEGQNIVKNLQQLQVAQPSDLINIIEKEAVRVKSKELSALSLQIKPALQNTFTKALYYRAAMIDKVLVELMADFTNKAIRNNKIDLKNFYSPHTRDSIEHKIFLEKLLNQTFDFNKIERNSLEIGRATFDLLKSRPEFSQEDLNYIRRITLYPFTPISSPFPITLSVSDFFLQHPNIEAVFFGMPNNTIIDSFKNLISGTDNYKAILLMLMHVRFVVMQRAKQEDSFALNNDKNYLILPQNDIDPAERVDIFNDNLVQWYDQRRQSAINNQNQSLALYRQFLPIFAASFFADTQHLNIGADFFRNAKISLIKSLPEAGTTLSLIQEIINNNGVQLRTLAQAIEIRFNEQGNIFSGSWIQERFGEIRRAFGASMAAATSSLTEGAFISVILTLAINMTPLGQVPWLGALGGMLGAFLWQNKIGPFVKNLWDSFIEAAKWAFSDKYTPKGVNEFILDMVMTALNAEIEMVNNDGWNDVRHQLSFSLFLQEELNILATSGQDLTSFYNRLNHLVPAAANQANLSILGLNFFYMFNKEAFTLLPKELLRSASSDIFPAAMREYFNKYITEAEQLIENIPPSERSMSYGPPSPAKQHLIDKARAGEFALNFSRNSMVYRLAEQFRANLVAPEVSYQITPNTVVPYHEVRLMDQYNNLTDFINFANKSSLLKPKFLAKLEQLTATIPINTPLREEQQKSASQGLISSYYMMRFCLSMARTLYNNSVTGVEDIDLWLRGSGETPKDILTSLLLQESFGVLMKTFQIAYVYNIENVAAGIESLENVRDIINSFLNTGILYMPTFAQINQIATALEAIIASNNPIVFVPVLIEYENNKSLLLPQVLIQNTINLLNEQTEADGAIVLNNNFNARMLYINNSDSELFFVTSGLRGFGFSPLTLKALDSLIAKLGPNRSLAQYLGIVSGNERDLIRSANQIERPFRTNSAMERHFRNMMARLPGGNRAIAGQNAVANTNEAQSAAQPLNQQLAYRPLAADSVKAIPGSANVQPIQYPEQNEIATGANYPPMPISASNQNANMGLNLPNNQVLPQMNNNQQNSMAPNEEQNQQIMPPLFMANENEAFDNALMQDQNEYALAQPIEAAQPLANQQQVLVNSQGGGATYNMGAAGPNNPLPPPQQPQPYDFIGANNAPAYNNPFNPQAPDMVAAQTSTVPWSKIAAGGAGLLAAGGALSYLLKNNDDADKDDKQRGQ